MRRVTRVILRATGALTTIPLALAGLSARGLAGIVLIVLIVVAALCWTITDARRSHRLAMLIRAVRGNPSAALPQPGILGPSEADRQPQDPAP